MSEDNEITVVDKRDVDDIISEVIDRSKNAIDANVLYREFIGQSNIEKVGEEDYVLKQIMIGTSTRKILEYLKAKYPDTSFTVNDFDKFLARNREVGAYLKEKNDLSARRHLKAREQCAEALAGLALYTQHLIKDFRAEGDNTNTVGAIRALNSTLENYMKLEGLVGADQEGGKVVNIINAVSEKKSSLRDRVHNANFVDKKTKEDTDSNI